MPQVVLNRCPRGTLFSDAGKAEYLKRKSLTECDWSKVDRTDAALVQMMREDKGKRIWAGECSQVVIVEIPDGIAWTIQSLRGREWIAAGGENA